MQKLNTMALVKKVEAKENTNRKGLLKGQCNTMDAASTTRGQTLTLCLRWESQRKFGKEFVALKSLLLGLGPETVFREVFRTDLDSGVKIKIGHELIFPCAFLLQTLKGTGLHLAWHGSPSNALNYALWYHIITIVLQSPLLFFSVSHDTFSICSGANEQPSARRPDGHHRCESIYRIPSGFFFVDCRAQRRLHPVACLVAYHLLLHLVRIKT